MQEKDKNVSTECFLTSYGHHITGGEFYFEEDDQTDQRAPVNDPQELFNQFIVPEDIMEELDAETIEDFDNDVYDYDDRTDLGVDIAQASYLNLKESISRKQNRKPSKPESEKISADERDESHEE